MYEYVKDFQNMGFGMFVHFGLYSVIGEGEWVKHIARIPYEKYDKNIAKFKVKKTWAKELVKMAKNAGCKYITLTTRHHDGFSLYDTRGLNDYDVIHSPTGRDLVREFVDECNAQGIVPFFYHTILDWHNNDYKEDFPKYIDYLIKSVEILCTQYGKIGGLWFDGYWDKPDADWQFDRLYAMIRKHQPTAMIINNTGMGARGEVGHPEIDSVTYERGKPSKEVDNADRPRASEMCEVFNSHWGFAKMDISYKPVSEILNSLVTCRSYNCNFLLNVGPLANGDIRTIDRGYMEEIGKWIKFNKNFIYTSRMCDITAENAVMLKGEDCYYAVVKAGMVADINVAINDPTSNVKINGVKIKRATWLDNGKRIKIKNKNEFTTEPFFYGTSMVYRVAKIVLE